MPYKKLGHAYRNGETYTEEEIVKAIKLRESGLQWDVIGERLGRTPDSLNSHASRYRRGKMKFRRAYYQSVFDEVVEARIAGVPMPVLSERYGMMRTALYVGLKRRGYDPEIIAELRDLESNKAKVDPDPVCI